MLTWPRVNVSITVFRD